MGRLVPGQVLRVLAVESSCDETGVAIVEAQIPQDGTPSLPRLLAQSLHTQIDMHRAYGGVVPELASRDHIRRVVPLIDSVLSSAGLLPADLDVVAYTAGPGLAGALLVGAGVAQAYAWGLGKPVMPVHHLEGHLLSPFLSQDPPSFPFVALLVSGGHTQLMEVRAVGSYRLLGESIDDAAGEAFDKCAMLLGFDYPGGAALSQCADGGNPRFVQFPRPLLHRGNLDFSFAGLKTSVATHVRKLDRPSREPWDPQLRRDLAASIQEAIVEVLVRKCEHALTVTSLDRLVVAGGVGANRRLREALTERSRRRSFALHFPELSLCTDNGAMIALAAALRLQAGLDGRQWAGAFEVRPRWPLSDLTDRHAILAGSAP
jgi:N6-L-threonylcarbamoyladenine synthase